MIYKFSYEKNRKEFVLDSFSLRSSCKWKKFFSTFHNWWNLFVCLLLSICFFICLSVCLSVCLPVRPSLRVFIYPSPSQSVCLSVYLSLSVCPCTRHEASQRTLIAAAIRLFPSVEVLLWIIWSCSRPHTSSSLFTAASCGLKVIESRRRIRNKMHSRKVEWSRAK